MKTIAIAGLGYVGLELAVSLSNSYHVIGYDILESRVNELKDHYDRNNLVSKERLSNSSIVLTTKVEDIRQATVFIVTVSTPAWYYLIPDLQPLIKSAEELAKLLKKGDLIVFESTVYPGTVDEVLTPILEKNSSLRAGQDFYIGYSPERINPNDKQHTLQNIPKVISGQNETALALVKEVYSACCTTLHPVSNIKTAEAVKILENTQRDVNIALMNEFTQIMHAMTIDMHEVLNAAKTKWSFVPFKPGFVGGHCIAVDPLYLAFKAKQEAIDCDLTLAARKINDNLTLFVMQSLIKIMLTNHMSPDQCEIGIFGITYKENTPDFRNSLALKMIKEMKKYGFRMRINDPLADPKKIQEKYHINLEDFSNITNLSVAIIVNAHNEYIEEGLGSFTKKFNGIPFIMDIPNMFADEARHNKNLVYWNL